MRTDKISNTNDPLMDHILDGNADLKVILWVKNKKLLEQELNYPKMTFEEIDQDYLKRSLKFILRQQYA